MTTDTARVITQYVDSNGHAEPWRVALLSRAGSDARPVEGWAGTALSAGWTWEGNWQDGVTVVAPDGSRYGFECHESRSSDYDWCMSIGVLTEKG